MKRLQIRNWKPIYQEKQGRGEGDGNDSNSAQGKALLYQNILGRQLPGEQIHLSSVCLAGMAH